MEPWSFSPPKRAATSRARRCWWMGASRQARRGPPGAAKTVIVTPSRRLLYWRRPRRQKQCAGLETHTTAGLESGVTIKRELTFRGQTSMASFRSIWTLLFLSCAMMPISAQAPAASQTASLCARSDALLHGFVDPPNEARPRVWWHWMNGNISAGRYQARSGLDASRGHGRRDHLRGRDQYAAGGAASPDLYDAGVEAGIQLRRDDGTAA